MTAAAVTPLYPPAPKRSAAPKAEPTVEPKAEPKTGPKAEPQTPSRPLPEFKPVSAHRMQAPVAARRHRTVAAGESQAPGPTRSRAQTPGRGQKVGALAVLLLLLLLGGGVAVVFASPPDHWRALLGAEYWRALIQGLAGGAAGVTVAAGRPRGAELQQVIVAARRHEPAQLRVPSRENLRDIVPTARHPVQWSGQRGVSVRFAFDSAQLSGVARHQLALIASELSLAGPGALLRVIGFADPAGSPVYNQDLSERRAAAVASYLASLGVAPGSMRVSGRGSATDLLPGEQFEPGGQRLVQVNIVTGSR